MKLTPEIVDAASDETRAAVDRFIAAALDEAAYVLENGTSEVKAALFKTIMPVLQRRLEGESESEQLAKVKAAQDELMDSLRMSLIPMFGSSPQTTVPEDTATAPAPAPATPPAPATATATPPDDPPARPPARPPRSRKRKSTDAA